MDLVQTVRKEGSRGGRGDFKWEDVKASSHRENYLGHSLMAPVGRWQKGKDLSWYARSGSDADKASAEQARKEEIRKVKEAEEEAMARALGYEIPPKAAEAGNASGANNMELGKDRGMKKALPDGAAEDDMDDVQQGIGHRGSDRPSNSRRREDMNSRDGKTQDGRYNNEIREHRSNDRRHERHRRSRSGSRSRQERRRHRKSHRHDRSGSRHRGRTNHERSRTRSRSRDRLERRDKSDRMDHGRRHERERRGYRRSESPRRRQSRSPRRYG